MIRWQKKRANKFPRWMCGVFVSYWLEFLIHIHNSPRVFAHFKLFVDEYGRVARVRTNFTSE